MAIRYAVIGNPVEHSRSPEIHHAFAKQEGVDVSYEKLLAPLSEFRAIAEKFLKEGGQGINVTLPFKGDAFEFADELTERAEAALAVNTLSLLPDGKILGDNTDGEGLVRDIQDNLDISLVAKRILVLGAGGAVRGVLEPLLKQQPLSLTIANRTTSKAEALADHFTPWGQVDVLTYDELAHEEFDVIINGTSTSLHNEIPPIPAGIFTEKSLAYDMVYAKGLTPFLQRAQSEKAAMLADGLGMLIEQAAVSYYIWRKFMPQTRAVTNAMRHELS